MTKSVIVTGSDASYFELLKGLVTSVRVTQPTAQDIVVLDCGLEASQREWLAKMFVSTVKPDWDFPVKGMGDWFKACIARPHLPKWVPGYEYYIWIDSDAWVQDWVAIDMLLGAAVKFGIAMVPAVDRAYPTTTGLAPHQHRSIESAWEYHLRRVLFSKKIADRYAPSPSINSGVFAARFDSPMWGHWSRRMESALERAQSANQNIEHEREVSGNGEDVPRPEFRLKDGDPTFMTDQTALNIALYRDLNYFARLPAWCNWLCHRALPIVRENGEFLEAGYPFRRVGIIHMTALTKNGEFELNVESGGTRLTSLRCPWVGQSLRLKLPTAGVR